MNNEARTGFLRKLVDQVRSHEYPYEKRPKKNVNWSAYDLAQINETADMLDLIKDLVDAADARVRARHTPEKREPGRPPTSAADVAKVLLAQSYLGVSNRVAEGLLRLFWHNLGINSTFSYKTIERGYDREAVNEILDEVMLLSNVPIQGLEKTFAIDGTGTPTHMKQSYAHDRERQNRERDRGGQEAAVRDAFPRGIREYVYSVGIVGTKYKLFASFQNTLDHSKGEAAFMPMAIAQTKALHPGMEMLTGDGLHATRLACQLTEDAGAVPRFLPKRNLNFKSYRSPAWIHMLMALSRDPKSWLRDYYQREAVETANSMVVMENPYPLRKRLDVRRLTEDYLRRVDHNIRGLCYLAYVEDLKVSPKSWTTVA